MFAYAETDDAQVLSLPYKGAPSGVIGSTIRGGQVMSGATAVPGPSTLSMVIILPKKVDGLADIEKQATAANLTKWATGLRRQAVTVFLPRFTMTTQFELSQELQALGMTEAFTRAADFSGISASAAGKLSISAVIHKAFVDVNEEGTEAAAATAVVMVRSMAMPGNRIEFRADHPFLFMIRHEPTGSILFLGRVNNPK
jgi:serpin B